MKRQNGIEYRKIRGLTRQGLRIWGLLFLLCGAVGYGIFAKGLVPSYGDQVPESMLLVGGIFQVLYYCAIPLFAFLLVQGALHTSSFKKYALRLLLVALVAEIPFNLCMNGTALGAFAKDCDACPVCAESYDHPHTAKEGEWICDICYGPVNHECLDETGDHLCDTCGRPAGHTCVDEKKDSKCDICDYLLPHKFRDGNRDDKCDLCTHVGCIDANGDLYCDDENCKQFIHHSCDDSTFNYANFSLNPVFGTLLCLVVIYFFRNYAGTEMNKILPKVLVFVMAFFWAEMLHIENANVMLVLTTTLWACRAKKPMQVFGGCVATFLCCIFHIGDVTALVGCCIAPLTFMIIHFYNGEPGEGNRLINYAAFPAMLLIAGLIALYGI